jgi:hypothetical protein
MKTISKILPLLLLATLSTAFAQTEPQQTVEALSSPKGVYIRIAPEALANRSIGQTKFTVKRKKMNETTARTIGQMQVVSTYAEFQGLVGEEEAQQFGEMKAFTSSTQVMSYFNSKPAYKEVELFGELKIEFLQAMGFAFLDKTAQPNDLYSYEIIETTAKDSETSVGEARIFYNPKNYLLNQIQPKLEKITGADSSVTFRWNVTFPTFTPNEAAYATLEEQLSKAVPNNDVSRINSETYNRIKAVYIENQKLVSIAKVDEMSTRFSVYYRKNDESRWKFLEKSLATMDSTGKNILIARIVGKLDDVVETIIIPEDYTYNLGDTTQIFRGVVAHNGSIELIYGVKAKEITNAIELSWKKLSDKPYYAGVEVARSWGDQTTPQVLQILPVTAEGYTDTDVFPAGRMFTYFVRPVFIEFQDLQQDIPASTAMTCGKFSRPTPPFNLSVTPEGPNAKLTWEVANEKAGHSYYVFRGTSPQNMIPIRSAVKETSYIDTTGYLSARLTYYYSVMAVNVTQDTSDYSPYVSYVPIKKEEVPIQTPPLIGYEIINDQAALSWADVKLNDDFIDGYVLQRKKKSDKVFTTIYRGPNVLFTDETFERGIEYLYRVASITIRNDTAAFSSEVEISANKEKDMPTSIENIQLTNLSKSIRVSWPGVEPVGIVQYKVYRKLPTEVNFKLLATLPNGNFEYEDKTVRNNTNYTYAVTVVNASQNESEIIETKNIVREATK